MKKLKKLKKLMKRKNLMIKKVEEKIEETNKKE